MTKMLHLGVTLSLKFVRQIRGQPSITELLLFRVPTEALIETAFAISNNQQQKKQIELTVMDEMPGELIVMGLNPASRP